MSAVEMKSGQFIPLCDMSDSCLGEVTYIDDSGFIYCTNHGRARQSWKPCRKLRPHELNRIKRGQQVERY